MVFRNLLMFCLSYSAMRPRKYIQISEEQLLSICSSAQMSKIIREGETVVRNEIDKPEVEGGGIRSETDSSDDQPILLTRGGEEIIRLTQLPSESPGRESLSLAIGKG